MLKAVMHGIERAYLIRQMFKREGQLQLSPRLAMTHIGISESNFI